MTFSRHASWLTALILILPTAVILGLFGWPEILRMNYLSFHDGARYFEVSLDPLGTTAYCHETMRYSRALFPLIVFVVAAPVAALLRGAGCETWLHSTIHYAEYDVPRFLLVQALIYHALLLVTCWFATRWVARVVGSSLVAILLIPVACQVFVLKGLLTPLDLGLTALIVESLNKWMRTERPTPGMIAAIGLIGAAALLHREVFFPFPVLFVVCHFLAHKTRQTGKLALALVAMTVPFLSWYVLVGWAQGANLFVEVATFVRTNSSFWPFVGIADRVKAGGFQALALLACTLYAAWSIVRIGWKALNQLRNRNSSETWANSDWPQLLWSLMIFVTFVRLGAPVLNGILNFGRALVQAPLVWFDLKAAESLARRWLGNAFAWAAGTAAVTILAGSTWYQYELCATRFARIKALPDAAPVFLKQIIEQPPAIYGVHTADARVHDAPVEQLAGGGINP